MTVVARTRTSLRLFGDDLEPSEISTLLGAEPIRSERKGSVRTLSTGREITARTGSWLLKVEPRAPGDLEAQVRELLSRLTSDLTVWRELSRRYSCDIFCGLFMKEGNEMEDVSPEVLVMLGERGIKLTLDIYDASPD